MAVYQQISSLENHSGSFKYNVHTYLEQNGKMIGISGQSITISEQATYVKAQMASNNTYDITIYNVPKTMSEVLVPVWSTVNDQDDIIWYTASKIVANTYKVNVPLSNHGFAYGTYSAHVYAYNSATKQQQGIATTSFNVSSVEGLENPSVSIANSNSANGTFTVNVSEKSMSKRIVSANIQVSSTSSAQKTASYTARTSSYGIINYTVDLKTINSLSDTYRVVTTVTYSDNSQGVFELSNKSYQTQSSASTVAGSPKITTYINESNTYPIGQCTWAVKYLAPWIPNYLGDARYWANKASALGFSTGTTPKVGAIVVWPNDGGGYGHVAYVTNVESNTRIQVKEANYAGKQYIGNFRGWFNPLDSFWGGNVSYIYPD